ncbi:MAG: isoleucine--tRNA ligase [Spirochaetales bacterium]|nr:isoleucine--tRNA ligase [Spirochaetales bacterium]
MYKPVDSKVNFPQMEENILKFWQNNRIFKKSIEIREKSEEYVFFDGPPFATGLPHFGHFVPGTLKDIFPRYQTMKGKKVDRRFGWDCHGLPVEYEMEKELGISGKKEIEDFGIAKFNESCRSIVLRYTKEWETIVTRMGRWVDFENDYKTMNPDYMESIWWVVKQLWEKGLMYEGYYILPYCPRCSTVLSNHELNLGGYKEVHDPAITVKFKVKGEDNSYILAWTTTPWTLPSNLALAVHNDIDYVKVSDSGEHYILAKERLSSYYKNESDYKIEWTKKGSELVGTSYEPLFPYFSSEEANGAFRVFSADYVTIEDGTGVVHTAPGFGEDDYKTLKDTKITTICPIDGECKFTSEVTDYDGRFVKDCDKDIIDRLKKEGKLVLRQQYLHNYPHCWRCSSPLIYRAISSWFVDIGKIKEKMLNANSQIYWMPSHLKDGRFGKWLENARDWAISRNRYWGNPIPIWKCDTCSQIECHGSKKELEDKSGVKLDDLHKHIIDEVTYKCSCGEGTMKRIPEVLDCWFESGAMPYAQVHYPFENKEHFESHFPADFICEGLDQTRGWFYTLTILAAALFDKPSFKNVVVNGLVLAEDGKKMSKSARNYTDPVEVINQYGADALRFFLTNSAVVRAEDLRYSDESVKEVLKSLIIPLWNAYSFFITYANIDEITVKDSPLDPDSLENPLDKWIISEIEKLVEEITAALDLYDIQKANMMLLGFVDILNNWYIRRSRRRFWKSENDLDKKQAYQTLYTVLMKLIKTACPVLPFITEEMYQNLKDSTMPESIHLCDYPTADRNKRDDQLEKKMEITRKVVSMGRALRSTFSLKIRQPLKSLSIVTREQDEKNILKEMSPIISEELNVKDVLIRENEDELVEYQAKANFRTLGKILGKNMKAGAEKIESFKSNEIKSLLDGSMLSIEIDGESFDITSDSVIVQRTEKEDLKVLNEGTITIGLDTKITEALREEGIVRDIVRNIQSLRKEKGLDVTDRINLWLSTEDAVKNAVGNYSDYLINETLTNRLEFVKKEGSSEYECGDYKCFIELEKV